MSKKTNAPANGSGNQNANDDGKTQDGKTNQGGGDDDTEEEDDGANGKKPGAKDDSKGGKKDGDDGKTKDSEEVDLSALPQETQDYIKKLRRESAKYRTKANNLETSQQALVTKIKSLTKAGGEGDDEEELSPEQQVEQLDAVSQNLSFDNAILSIAIEHGVDKASIRYFRFLVSEKMQELGEGEELSDEDLADLAEEASKTSGRKSAKTSVTGSDDGKGSGKSGKAPGNSKTIDIAQFMKMTVSQKTELRNTNEDLYVALMTEAKEKRLFV